MTDKLAVRIEFDRKSETLLLVLQFVTTHQTLVLGADFLGEHGIQGRLKERLLQCSVEPANASRSFIFS